jgi:hypothetical protein
MPQRSRQHFTRKLLTVIDYTSLRSLCRHWSWLSRLMATLTICPNVTKHALVVIDPQANPPNIQIPLSRNSCGPFANCGRRPEKVIAEFKLYTSSADAVEDVKSHINIDVVTAKAFHVAQGKIAKSWHAWQIVWLNCSSPNRERTHKVQRSSKWCFSGRTSFVTRKSRKPGRTDSRLQGKGWRRLTRKARHKFEGD